jgi:histidinol-phosphate aminotransferase
MQRDILSLLRPHIARIKPYSSARSEYSGKAAIMLDANENPYGAVLPQALNRYPDPLQRELKQKVSELKQIPVENIFLGNGSDEPIDLLMRAFCEPGKDQVIILPPTYGMYETSATINNVDVIPVMLRPDFQPDISAILERSSPNTKLLFLCSPNNPTGNLMDPAAVDTLVSNFPGLVVIDEAYIDFTTQPSRAEMIATHPNVVVLQTLSKAWGLANIRLGMAFADPALVAVLNNIKAPYNINGITQMLALEALHHEAAMKRYVSDIIAQRNRLVLAFAEKPFIQYIHPSEANFLLVKVAEPDSLYSHLTANGIVVRNRSREPLCGGCLRITVGTPEENNALLLALETFR